MKRIDERDTMFARMSYKKGSKAYEDYYRRHPDKKNIDDSIREKPHLCSEGTATFDEILSPIADANFAFLGGIRHLAEGPVNPNKVETDAKRITRVLKGLAEHYGACLVGVTKMKEEHYYSHRGRHEENYGDEVKVTHPYGIVFAVEMDKEMINRSPQVAEVIETSKAYVDVGIIGMQLAYYIRQLGYDARNHMDANYLVIAPHVAASAGLGQIGRNTLLITKKYGSRVRLGVVTTELSLDTDEPIDFGLEAFCLACGKCVRTCPGKAISSEDDSEKWYLEQEKCYNMWRSIGTDCGICISACPFSQSIDLKLIDGIKGNADHIQQLLKIHEDKYGIRPYIKEQPKWF